MPRLERLIDEACSPSLGESDVALNLDVCDVINTKRQNAPHNAAVRIAKHIRNGNQRVNILALELLDFCVKNCGHAFHYQIATKEFLVELVSKFPCPAPSKITVVQFRILELLQEWRRTLCRHSRYKDDLVNIDKMAKKLEGRGYNLPEVEVEPSIILGPADELKSPEEKEREDRLAMGAKLQELLRRGNPADLQEANELMKVMSGYEQDDATRDYQLEWRTELDTIDANTCYLAHALLRYPLGHELDGEARKLFNTCVRHQKKIQQLIQDNEDHEDLGRLLYLNDIIGETLQAGKGVELGQAPPTLAHAKPNLANSKQGIAGTAKSTATVPLSPSHPSYQFAEPVATSLIDFNDDIGPTTTMTSQLSNKSDQSLFTAQSVQGAGDNQLCARPSSGRDSWIDDLSGLEFENLSMASRISTQTFAPLTPYTPNRTKGVTTAANATHVASKRSAVAETFSPITAQSDGTNPTSFSASNPFGYGRPLLLNIHGLGIRATIAGIRAKGAIDEAGVVAVQVHLTDDITRTIVRATRDDSRSPERKSRKSKKKRRKEKDGKSSSTRSKVSAINQQYGKHGVLYETDIYTKEEEFNLWLYETKKLRPEEMSNPDSKRHFREFMEDYNTVTLPHEK
ncbi:ARF-binding protein [Dimargaris verticillata]|uniref:ARF-binding protein n=1 Tax=Dimargaris verticillata TaxID=2761393 RepID=A0A9W8B9V1_9FUNG|nr:ARF-binding protein [Dimargaris verticillata]